MKTTKDRVFSRYFSGGAMLLAAKILWDVVYPFGESVTLAVVGVVGIIIALAAAASGFAAIVDGIAEQLSEWRSLDVKFHDDEESDD